MRIAITGTPGVGKTTVSKVLGEKLGIKTYMALSPLISPKDNLKEGIKSIDKKIKQFKDIGFKYFAIFLMT